MWRVVIPRMLQGMSDGVRVMFPAGNEAGRYLFWCEGCNCAHGIDAGWSFDGDLVEPTISPSVLSQGQTRCHSFVRKGMIEYLPDSEHELAGQTVRMVPLPWRTD